MTQYKNFSKENLNKIYTMLVLECEKENKWENLGGSWVIRIEKYKEDLRQNIVAHQSISQYSEVISVCVVIFLKLVPFYIYLPPI